MPPAYGSFDLSGTGSRMSNLGSSYEEEQLLVHLMKKRAATYLIPKRYIFSLLAFSACCLTVSYNVNLSIAIVSMVKEENKAINSSFARNASVSYPLNLTQAMQLDWNSNIESIALGAVYYGQLVSFIPVGRMAELYGGKRMLLISMLLATLATLALPITAFWSPYAFIANRVVVGLGTGPIIPIVFYMLVHWIPERERSFHASFILSGYGIGSFLAVIISGALCGTTFLDGWPSVFYIGGVCGLVWFLICAYMMCETPDQHSNISDDELNYIMTEISTVKKQKILKIPWKSMALSVPLWALAIGFFGQFWLLGFFSTVHALYMGIVLKLTIVQNGVLSCLPHLLRAFATCMASYPVDILLRRKVVSINFVRKSATAINSVVSCAAFFAITLVGKNVPATTLLFVLGGVLGEFVTFGVCMACVDIAPGLSGTVSGLINIVGVFPFFIIPSLVGGITHYEDSIEEWKKVFYVSISIVLISTLIFVVFGDLNPQSWGIAPDSKSKENEDPEKNDADDKKNTKRKELVLS